MRQDGNAVVHIGGQAVIEGVMIRNRDIYSIAVRKPDGTIEVITREIKTPIKKYRMLRAPFIRGITMLIENLVLGIKSLLYSAQIAMPEEDEADKDEDQNKKRKNKLKKGKSAKDSSNLLIFFSLIPALLLGVVLFIVMPNLATHYLGIVEKSDPFMFHIIAGFIRLAMFLIYIFVISLLKDIRRTFQYHGAEHKSIFCYEAGKPLIVEEAKKFKTLHPRCGTSFLFFVFVIAILVFPVVTVAIEYFYSGFVSLPLLYRKIITIVSHLVIALPLIASLSYELLKLSDKMKHSFPMKVLISPGLFLQMITTKEPDEKQLEVALEAVKAVL